MKTGSEPDLVTIEYPASNPEITALASSNQPALTTDARPLQVPQAMCEAYDYPSPSAFSRGMEVDIGSAKLVFVSGTASVGPNGKSLHLGDFRAQALLAFQNARSVLNAAGADWQHVVKATFFLKDIARYYSPFNEVRCAYFKGIDLEVYPASTCIEAKLCRDELLVEMELMAVVRTDG